VKASIRATIAAIKPKPLKEPKQLGKCVQCRKTIRADGSGHDARCNATADPQ